MDETGWRYAYNVESAWWIKDRGLAIHCDWSRVPNRLVLKIGDAIRIHRPDGSILPTVVTGIELGGGPLFGFELPESARESDVPPGSEVWVQATSIHCDDRDEASR